VPGVNHVNSAGEEIIENNNLNMNVFVSEFCKVFMSWLLINKNIFMVLRLTLWRENIG